MKKLSSILDFCIEKAIPKLGFLVVIGFIIVELFFSDSIDSILRQLYSLSDATIGSINTVASVFIGFFATIVSIFASSQNEAIRRLARSKKTILFSRYSKIALVACVSALIMSMFFQVFKCNRLFAEMYVVVIVCFLTTSIRFSYICLRMLEYSISSVESILLKEDEDRIKAIENQKRDS